LVVSFTSKTDVPITQYLWYLSNGVTSHQSSFTYKFNDVGTYDAKLVVESVDGCKDSVFVPGIVSTYPLPNVAFSMSSHSIFTDEPLVPILSVCPPISITRLGLSTKKLYNFSNSTYDSGFKVA
jgi:PKD repeat protein